MKTVIALDLDGTLTNSQKQVTPLTRNALLRAQEQGATIVLASGRPTYGIAPVAKCLELEERGGYLLSYNGGKIVDWHTKEQLFSAHLPASVLPRLHQYARSHGFALLGYSGQQILTELPPNEYSLEESRINQMPLCQVENLLEKLDAEPTKLLLTGHPDDMLQAEQQLREMVGTEIEVYRSAPFFVELVAKGIDKAQSLLRLLAHLRLSPADLWAFGDGYNDLSMLRLAACGVAMANAAPEVRAQANFVTLSNDEDGVGRFLEDHLFVENEDK